MKLIFCLIFSAFLVFVQLGCSSRKVKVDPTHSLTPATEQTSTPRSSFAVRPMEVSYRNGSSLVTLYLDPLEDDMHLMMTGRAIPIKEPLQDTVKLQTIQPPQPSQPSRDQWDQWGEDPNLTVVLLEDMKRAQEFFYAGDYAQAERIVKSVIERKESADALAFWGSVLLMMGENRKAREVYERALRLNPAMSDVRDILKKMEP
jgi:hypothetical protein